MKHYLILSLLLLISSIIYAQQPLTAVQVSGDYCETSTGACFGILELAVSGGTPPYTYYFDDVLSSNYNYPVCAGIYEGKVIDSQNDSMIVIMTIMEFPELEFFVDQMYPSCNSNQLGWIEVTFSGGAGNPFVSWQFGLEGTFVDSLQPGIYSGSVNDSFANCFSVFQVYLQQYVEFIESRPTCANSFDGSLDVSSFGGYPPYTYLWSTGDTTSVINNLAPGTYNVTVTDSTGCSVTEAHELHPLVLANISTSVISPCIRLLTANMNSPNAPIIYIWSTGDTSKTISITSPGLYSVTTTDAAGCDATNFLNLLQVVNKPNVNPNIVNPTCFGASDGSIALNISGGTGQKTISWNTGATTANLSNLSAGMYSATVTDVNACDTIVTINLTQPSEIDLGLLVQQIDCNDSIGAISTVVTGGVPPL